MELEMLLHAKFSELFQSCFCHPVPVNKERGRSIANSRRRSGGAFKAWTHPITSSFSPWPQKMGVSTACFEIICEQS